MKTIMNSIQPIMKNANFFYILFSVFTLFTFNNCVHDDDYGIPEVECENNFTSNVSMQELKSMFSGNPVQIQDDLVLEGYVSSSDETGNIYKTLYIQDALENPTMAFTVSVDQTDLYASYPMGYKVYIKLKGLWLGEYGGVVQIGDMGFDNETQQNEFGRIPAVKIPQSIVLGCDHGDIVPYEVEANQLNDNLIGALVKVKGVELIPEYVCKPFADVDQTSNRLLENCNGSTLLLRNSGYSNFAQDIMPSGNGDVVAILGKYGSDYQLLLNNGEGMAGLSNPRCSGYTVECNPNIETNATIQQVKEAYNGGLTQIADDLVIKGVITANDASGNFYRLVYIEDETGGIRLRLNRNNLYTDSKYAVGNTLIVRAKDLYVDDVNGEIQLGDIYNGNLGNIEEEKMLAHVINTETEGDVTPTVLSIDALSTADIGKLVTIENVEFLSNDAAQPFALNNDTNRTFTDCNGNTLIVRTSSYADFKNNLTPEYNGKITGILNTYNGTYQIWIRDLDDVDMNGVKCDGTVPPVVIFSDDFSMGDFTNWTTVNILGTQVWEVSTQGTSGNPYAKMSGYSGGSNANEDWLISNPIDLSGNFSDVFLNFDSDRNYNGPDLEVFITNSYTGDVTTTNWTPLAVNLDSASGWGFYNSGNFSLSTYMGQTVQIAFKYTSTASESATWEIDNFKVFGIE